MCIRQVFTNTELWGTADGLMQVGSDINPAQVTVPFFPGPGGIRFRFFTFMPNPPKGPDQGKALLENA